MSASTWQTVGVISALFFGVVTVYFLVKSNIREQAKSRKQENDRAVTDAKAPLIADNAQLRLDKQRSDDAHAAEVTRLRAEKQRSDEIHAAELERKDARITELEDRLYGRGGL